MKKQLTGLLFIVLAVGLLFGLTPPGVFAEGEVFEGSKVYINDSNVYLSADPHTLGSSGWVEFEFIPKNYSGDIDLAWGFDSLEGVSVSQPQVFRPNVPYQASQTVEKYGTIRVCNVTNQTQMALGSAEPDYGNTNNSYLYRVVGNFLCSPDNNQTEAVVAFDTYEVFPDWIEVSGYYDASEAVTKYKDDWVDWTADFHSAFFTYSGVNKWYYLTGVDVTAGQAYKARCWVDVPFDPVEAQQGEYYFAVKPSGESLWEAQSNGHLYVLDPWYNATWLYRQELVVNGSSAGAVTNYQLMVTVSKDGTGDINCTSGCRDDFGDLRFTQSDGDTLLDYYLETVNSGDNATFWVEFNSIPASPDNATFYAYYGNPTATTTSSGVDTFLFFDDFSGDLSKWDTQSGTWVINAGEQLEKTSANGNAAIYSDALIAIPDLGYRMKVFWDDNSSTADIDNCWGLSATKNTLDPAVGYYGSYTVHKTNQYWQIKEWTGGGWAADLHQSSGQGLIGNRTLTRESGGNTSLYKDYTYLGSGSDSTLTDYGVNRYIRIYSYPYTIWDNAWVGNYCEEEPSLTSLTEETAGAPAVQTWNATSVATTTAVMWGNVTDVNATNIVVRGFDYDIDSGAPYASNVSEAGLFGLGNYSINETFASDTKFYFRAFVMNNENKTAYGEELNFTTLPPLPLEPTNLTIEFSNVTGIELTWTLGINATNTLIIGNLGSYPSDYTNGWEVYNSTGTTVNDSVGDTTFGGVYYRAWSNNPTGFSLESASAMVGGGSMLLLAFIGLACFFTWFSSRRRDILLSIVAALLWFSTAMWLFFSGSTPFDLSEGYVQILVWVFILLAFVPFIFQMNVEVRKEGKKGTSYTYFAKRGMENGKPETEYQRYRRLLQKRTRPKRRKR